MPAASVLPPASCVLNPQESLFSFLISEIIVSGMLSPGSIVDCGAHKGGEACLYASLAPARTVHAIEPQGMHISTMTRQYGSYLPNLRPLKGGLGSRDRTASVHGAHSPSMLLNVHARPDANASSPHINIHKLDTLYLDDGFFASERLGFAHFDVEGSEEDLLLGAQRVLQRDRPTFTLELMLRARQAGATGEFTAARLIREVDRLGYQVLFVPEQCGIPTDCRNVMRPEGARREGAGARHAAHRARRRQRRVQPGRPHEDPHAARAARQRDGVEVPAGGTRRGGLGQ